MHKRDVNMPIITVAIKTNVLTDDYNSMNYGVQFAILNSIQNPN